MVKINGVKNQLSLLFATILSAAFIGSCIAFFLWLLEKASAFRNTHPIIIYGLPIAGILIVFSYHQWGKISSKGNNLIIEAINGGKEKIPFIMTPLVLFGTVLTHLFGGSAGREGTAVQIGGSLAENIGKIFSLTEIQRKTLLISGMAAGFGAVFGTPLTGFLFALEVVVIGQIRYQGAFHALIAAFVGDYICRKWGIRHTAYPISTKIADIQINITFIGKMLIAGICFGIAANLFSSAIYYFKTIYKKYISTYWLVPVCGGVTLLILSLLFGNSYLGLGVTPNSPGDASIVGAFTDANINSYSWLLKLLFTTITLSSGFKGGEVTPLFFIGATLGNALGHFMGLPIDLMAALGFIAVFAGATNTPIACSVMGLELFGGQFFPLFVSICFIAYFANGYSGIYESQQILFSKTYNSQFSFHKTLNKLSYQKRLRRLRAWKQFKERFL